MIDHDEFLADIPSYVGARLEASRCETLEAHLRECSSCKEVAEAIRDLAPGLRDGGHNLIEAHPDVLNLRDFVRNPLKERDSTVARHIESCPSCDLEIRAWRELDLTVRAPGVVDARSRFRAGRRAALAFAVGIVMGAALWAGIGWRFGTAPDRGDLNGSRGDSGERLAGWSGPVDLFILRSPTRGEDAIPTVVLDPGAPRLLVAVQLILPENDPGDPVYQFEIRSPRGGVDWSSSMTGLQIREHLKSSDVVVFAVPGAELGAGRHTMIVTRHEGPDERLFLEIPFRLNP